LYVFSAFSSVNFVLFWAQSVAEHATDLATLAETSLHYQYQYHMIARYPRAAREANSSHSEIGGDNPCYRHLSESQ
jgi:hypothetical protein